MLDPITNSIVLPVQTLAPLVITSATVSVNMGYTRLLARMTDTVVFLVRTGYLNFHFVEK